MNVFYFTQPGYDALVKRLNEKKAEHKKVRDDRAEALKDVGESDMNDPELVDLQQREIALNTMVMDLEKALCSAQVVAIDERKRNTASVQIGSIVKIKRYNVTTDQELPAEFWEIRGYDESDVARRRLAYNAPLASHFMHAVAGECIDDIKVGDSTFEISIVQLFANWDEARKFR